MTLTLTSVFNTASLKFAQTLMYGLILPHK